MLSGKIFYETLSKSKLFVIAMYFVVIITILMKTVHKMPISKSSKGHFKSLGGRFSPGQWLDHN